MEPGVSLAKLDFDPGELYRGLGDRLGVSTFGLNVMVLEPGQGTRIHRHGRQEEVYVVLEGTLTLDADGERHTLQRGDAARVAPDVKRQLINLGDDRLAIVAMGGAQPHEGRDGMAYLSWDDEEPKSPKDVPFPDNLR